MDNALCSLVMRSVQYSVQHSFLLAMDKMRLQYNFAVHFALGCCSSIGLAAEHGICNHSSVMQLVHELKQCPCVRICHAS